jgi:hypothetical protein
MPSSHARSWGDTAALQTYNNDVATSASSYEEKLAHVRIVRELGARAPATHLAESADGSKVVLETYANVDSEAMRVIGESAQRLRGVKHPHLVSVLSVERIGVAWSIVTEHIDGVSLEDVFFGMSLGGRLRSLVDILTALSALHVPFGQGLPLVHGGCLLRSAFVEKSGRTKLGFAYRSAMCIGRDTYAPEALLGDTIDARTDVYGAGVLLWEAVTGRSLFGNDPPEQVVKKQLAGRVGKALPRATDRWARSLLPVIDRALATDPKARFATIAEMAAALRIAVRARLMFHDDIVEELWPAPTVPRVASGVQPAAQAPTAPESETRIIVDPPAPAPSHAPARIGNGSCAAFPARVIGKAVIESPLAPPAPPVLAYAAAGAGIIIAVVAIVIACVIRVHHAEPRGGRSIATAPAPEATEASPLPVATSTSVETVTTAPSPPVPTTVAPVRKALKHSAKPQATYDPSSI